MMREPHEWVLPASVVSALHTASVQVGVLQKDGGDGVGGDGGGSAGGGGGRCG